MSRIQFTRDQLLTDFVEVGEPPEILQEKFARAPFCHLLSKYVIRPVACDQLPFFIHHKNKQPIFMQEKKGPRRETKEVQGFSSSEEEDEFEKVKTDNKRGAKKTSGVEVPVSNPQFPASDPTKVKVVAPNAKKTEGKVPTKMGLDLGAVPKEDEKITRPVTTRKDQVADKNPEEQKITRPATAKKQKAAPKKEPENNYFAAAMQQKEPAAKPVKTEAAPLNPPQSAGGKKKQNKKVVEEKKQEEQPKPVKAPQQAAPAKPAANDFMAQMAAGAMKTQEQDAAKKELKAKKRAGKAVQEPDFMKTNIKQNKGGLNDLYK